MFHFPGIGEEFPALPPLQPRPGVAAAWQGRYQRLQHGLQVRDDAGVDGNGVDV